MYDVVFDEGFELALGAVLGAIRILFDVHVGEYDGIALLLELACYAHRVPLLQGRAPALVSHLAGADDAPVGHLLLRDGVAQGCGLCRVLTSTQHPSGLGRLDRGGGGGVLLKKQFSGVRTGHALMPPGERQVGGGEEHKEGEEERKREGAKREKQRKRGEKERREAEGGQLQTERENVKGWNREKKERGREEEERGVSGRERGGGRCRKKQKERERKRKRREKLRNNKFKGA